jgi:hypothetical protein
LITNRYADIIITNMIRIYIAKNNYDNNMLAWVAAVWGKVWENPEHTFLLTAIIVGGFFTTQGIINARLSCNAPSHPLRGMQISSMG